MKKSLMIAAIIVLASAAVLARGFNTLASTAELDPQAQPGAPAAAPQVRPVKDDVGFCWNPASMKTLVDYLHSIEKESFPADGLVAAISPHDDYLYAGRLYYPLFRMLRAKEVVIFGVTHGTVRSAIPGLDSVLIFDEFKLWPGLNKPVEPSGLREFLKGRLDKSLFITSNQAHTIEHSIEALLPFLQYFNPDVKITPLMVAPMPFARMDEISGKLAEAIAAYMKERGLAPGKDVFFLVSSDGNHYGQDFKNSPYGEGEAAWEKALAFDRRLIKTYLEGSQGPAGIEGLTKELWGKTYLDYRSTYWCGKYSVPFGLLTAEKVIDRVLHRKIRGALLRYSDTYSEGVLPLKKTGMGLTAPFSLRHWVSFFSIGYYLE
jgi:MEMO1 family protein